jgi:hypothetical protein
MIFSSFLEKDEGQSPQTLLMKVTRCDYECVNLQRQEENKATNKNKKKLENMRSGKLLALEEIFNFFITDVITELKIKAKLRRVLSIRHKDQAMKDEQDARYTLPQLAYSSQHVGH